MPSFTQVGIISTARLLPDLIKPLQTVGFTVKAVWCRDVDSTVQLAAEFDIPFAASLPSEVVLRRDVQMVIISGCPCIHTQTVVSALGIGKHVLCDIPVSLSEVEALKLVDAAEYYPQLSAMSGFGLRHLPVFKTIRNRLDSGTIGQVHSVEVRIDSPRLHSEQEYNWLCCAHSGGGVLNLVGSHVIDLLTFLLCGRRVVTVQGVVKSFRTKLLDAPDVIQTPASGKLSEKQSAEIHRVTADDYASFLLSFEGGIEVSVCITTFRQPKLNNKPNNLISATNPNNKDVEFSITIFGDLGSMKSNGTQLQIDEYSSGIMETESALEADGTNKSSIFSLSSVDHFQSCALGRLPIVWEGLMALFRDLMYLAASSPPPCKGPVTSPTKKHDTTQLKNTSNCHVKLAENANCDFASMKDALYIQTVINAVRESSESRSAVRLRLPA